MGTVLEDLLPFYQLYSDNDKTISVELGRSMDDTWNTLESSDKLSKLVEDLLSEYPDISTQPFDVQLKMWKFLVQLVEIHIRYAEQIDTENNRKFLQPLNNCSVSAGFTKSPDSFQILAILPWRQELSQCEGNGTCFLCSKKSTDGEDEPLTVYTSNNGAMYRGHKRCHMEQTVPAIVIEDQLNLCTQEELKIYEKEFKRLWKKQTKKVREAVKICKEEIPDIEITELSGDVFKNERDSPDLEDTLDSSLDKLEEKTGSDDETPQSMKLEEYKLNHVDDVDNHSDTNGELNNSDMKEFDDGWNNDDMTAAGGSGGDIGAGSDSAAFGECDTGDSTAVVETGATATAANNSGLSKRGRRTTAATVASAGSKLNNEVLPFMCDICTRRFQTKRKLSAHIRFRHKSTKNYCDQCDYETIAMGNLKRHIRTKHEGIRFPCDECNYTGSTSHKVKEHKRLEHEGFRYKCSECDYTAKANWNLNQHILIKHQGQRYFCEFCGASFKAVKTLDGHRLDKHMEQTMKPDPDGNYNCTACAFTCTDDYTMRLHRMREHTNPLFLCDMCGYAGKSKYHLLNHIEMEHKGFRHQCNQCDYTAKYKANLKAHVMQKHEKMRFTCDECPFTCSQKDILKRHKWKKHEGIEFPCDQCDYKAREERFLKNHIKSEHEGVRYSCDQCSSKFRSNHNLRSHKVSKHGDESVTCKFCKQVLPNSKHLRDHVRAEHKDQCFQCEMCDYLATREDSLHKHRTKLH